MLVPEKDGKEPIRSVLESAYDVIIDRLVYQSADAVGIILFGVEATTGESLNGCKILLDLGVPTVGAVKNLKESIEGILIL